MQFLRNVPLLPYNTFGIDMPAASACMVDDVAQLQEIAEEKDWHELHVIGGGSNILLTQPVKGTVLFNRLQGIERIQEDDTHVWLRVASGEVWHTLVLYAIAAELGGIENLALIPGTVGAAPMQNIGAYGVEARETIDSVTAWHWADKQFITLNNADCQFGYRDSIFKHALKGKVFITEVVFKLTKHPAFNTSYGAIGEQLQKMGAHTPSLEAIANAVIAIRTSKLPDPKQIGNAGSFFKNPTIPLAEYQDLQQQFPNMPSYRVSDTQVKIPAGWMIEQQGWKGHRTGDAGVHEKQALVLVNHGHAPGKAIYDLSSQILQSVQDAYGIALEREVQIW